MYEYVKKISNMNVFDISNFEENVHLVTYSMIVFLTPFLIGHPQFIVGTIVNSALILSAMYLKNFKILPVIILPSLGVLTKGLIFGPYTIFLLYMVPFVWIGNSILVYGMKMFHIKSKMSYGTSLVISSVLKTAFLFVSAYVMYSAGILPVIFLTAMGMLQIYTAITGGIVAYGVVKIIR